jgi:hypothetical protein
VNEGLSHDTRKWALLWHIFNFWHTNFLAAALDGSVPLNMLAILFERTGTKQLYPVTVQGGLQKGCSINWVLIRFATDETMNMIDVEYEGACGLVHGDEHRRESLKDHGGGYPPF